jgi:hypothetical protein
MLKIGFLVMETPFRCLYLNHPQILSRLFERCQCNDTKVVPHDFHDWNKVFALTSQLQV